MDKVKWIKLIDKKPEPLQRVLVSFPSKKSGSHVKSDNIIVIALYVPPLSLKKDDPEIKLNPIFFQSRFFAKDKKTGIVFVAEGFFQESWDSYFLELRLNNNLMVFGLCGEQIEYWAKLPECDL